MSEGPQLLLIIAIIYLSDCLWWIPRNGWFLTGVWPRGLRAAFTGPLGNAKGAFRTLHPLPAFHVSFELGERPYSAGPKGWTPFTVPAYTHTGRPPLSTAFVPWSDPAPKHSGNLVYAGEARLDARSEANAARVCADLAGGLPPMGYAIDPQAIRERAEEAHRLSRPCRIAGLLQFCAMFLLAPLLCRLLGLGAGILVAASVVLVLALVNAGLYLHAHRRLYPQARGERWKAACVMVLSFPMSARSADLLTRHALLAFDAPAVVAALATPRTSKSVLQAWWRDLCHPLALGGLTDDTAATVQAQLESRQSFWTGWWLDGERATWREGVDATPEAPYWCPRCLAAYELEQADCPDCPGVRLRRTPASPDQGADFTSSQALV